MIKSSYKEQGFTLLELLISIAIIAVIVAIALGGMKFGITAREIGDQRTETFQRLRFIGEQISTQIKSLHPLFIEATEVLQTTPDKPATTEVPKVLAFEGTENSLRFITFAETLAHNKRPPWMHETLFYLGENPETGKTGIVMMEREISFDDIFTPPDPSLPGVRYVMLAEDVSHLKFRYFKFRKLTLEELKEQTDKTIDYTAEWTDQVLFNQNLGQLSSQLSLTAPQNRYSLPRAIAVSVGLKERPVPGKNEELKTVYLPYTVIPMHVGIEFSKPRIVIQNEAS